MALKVQNASRPAGQTTNEVKVTVAGSMERSKKGLEGHLFVEGSDVLVPTQGMRFVPSEVELVDAKSGKTVARAQAKPASTTQSPGATSIDYRLSFKDAEVSADGKYFFRVPLEGNAVENGKARGAFSDTFETAPFFVSTKAGKK